MASEDDCRTAAAASRPAASTATPPPPVDKEEDDRSPIARLLLRAADAALAVELINATTAVFPIPSRSLDDEVIPGLIGEADAIDTDEEDEEEEPAADADVAPNM